MKNKISYIIGLLAVLLFYGCGKSGADDGRPVLAVSVEPQRYLLEKIAGDGWRVVTMLEKGSDPESFDPSMGTIASVMGAKAYFLNGQLPFEEMLQHRIRENNADIRLVDTSEGITLISGTHHHHDDGHNHHDAGFDPHTWSSVRNAMAISDNMLRAMIEIDADNAQLYKENHAKLKAELQSIDKQYSEKLSSGRNMSFMMWHPSLSYFARDYGLNQIAVDSDNKELSAGQLKQKIDTARMQTAQIFIVQPEYDHRRSKELAGQINAKLIDVNLLSYDWVKELDKVVNALTE